MALLGRSALGAAAVGQQARALVRGHGGARDESRFYTEAKGHSTEGAEWASRYDADSLMRVVRCSAR